MTHRSPLLYTLLTILTLTIAPCVSAQSFSVLTNDQDPNRISEVDDEADGLAIEEREARNQNEGLYDTARTAEVGFADVGERVESQAVTFSNPLDRIDNRVRNRIENRLRNRIDRDYDPTANTTSPFRRAEDSTRRASDGPN